MIKREKYAVSTNIENLDFYFKQEPIYIYIRDLKHQAPKLIKEALARTDIKVYKGSAARKTAKMPWIQHLTYGLSTPTTLCIKFSNGVVLYEYQLFDPDDRVSEEEMLRVADELDQFGHKMTGCQIIRDLLPEKIASIPTSFTSNSNIEDYYSIIANAFHGGANYIMKKNERIKKETHVDYHQLYASVMLNHSFPRSLPIEVDGYYPHELAIYQIAKGEARLKPKGFPILPKMEINWTGEPKMFASDGEWHSLLELDSISSVDIGLLYKNYEVRDFEILKTLYYPLSFSGKEAFGDLIHMIYEKRKTTTGSVKRFYKLMNEYLPGYFERTVRPGKGWWQDLDSPVEHILSKKNIFNPIVGVFITAYGRQQLDALLHMFPYETVIGYDTDCVFAAMKAEDTPKNVKNLFGDGIGQLHFDGIYQDVIHTASKRYSGYDLENHKKFIKAAGMSKSGLYWKWNKDKKEYELVEVKKNG